MARILFTWELGGGIGHVAPYLPIANSCDITITHSTHATIASFLLAGKPLLLLPIYLEQGILAHNLEQTGTGLVASPLHPQDMISKLEILLNEPRFMLAAEHFAKKYADFDADKMTQQLINHIDHLLDIREQ